MLKAKRRELSVFRDVTLGKMGTTRERKCFYEEEPDDDPSAALLADCCCLFPYRRDHGTDEELQVTERSAI